MKNIRNFRQLAYQIPNKQGKYIKTNMIFRSGELNRMDEEDTGELKELGIHHIYDLRSSIERQKDTSLHKVETISFDVVNSKSNTAMDKAFLEKVAPEAMSFMLMLYREHLAFSKKLKPLMQTIMKEQKPFLFHCAAGKDRTGIVGALIMAVLEFDEKDIIHEYCLLEQDVIKTAEVNLKKQGLAEDLIKQLRPLNGVHHSFIEAFLDVIKERYNNMDHYISEFLSLNEVEIRRFREMYLERID